MKTAKVSIASVEFSCPECGEGIPEPNSGSLYWTIAEINVTTAKCLVGHEVLLPKNVHSADPSIEAVSVEALWQGTKIFNVGGRPDVLTLTGGNMRYDRDIVKELQEEMLQDAMKTNRFDPHFLDCGQDDSFPDEYGEDGDVQGTYGYSADDFPKKRKSPSKRSRP